MATPGERGAGRPAVRFSHPYTPYTCQTALMHALYAAAEAGRAGIFESPTGTVRA